MPRKLKQLAQHGGDGKFVAQVRESASQIWLAGLGAFAKAQEEGTKIFDALVEDGEAVQKLARKTAVDAFDQAKTKAAKTWGQVSWDQLENVFEDRVGRALHSLSVPTRKDLDTLAERVAELTAATKKLAEMVPPPAVRGRPVRTRAVRKGAARHA